MLYKVHPYMGTKNIITVKPAKFDDSYFKKVTSIFSICMDKDGILRFRYNSIVTILTEFIIVIHLVYIFVLLWHAYIFFTGDLSFERGVLYITVVLSGLLRIVTAIAFLEVRKLEKFVNRFGDFELDFERKTQRALPRWANWRTNVVVFGLAVLIGVSLAFGGLKKVTRLLGNDENFIGQVIAYGTNYSYVVINAAILLWRLLNGAIKHCADCLLEDIESGRWMETRTLKEHFKLWLRVRELCSELGHTLCWTFLVLCAFVFVMSLTNIFIVVQEISTGDYAILVPSALTISFISVVVEIAHQAVKKVGTTFQTRLTRALLQGKFKGHEAEVDWFIKGIRTYPPSMTFGDFFTLERGVNMSLYSSIITYVIIIVQFRSDASSGDLNSNDTSEFFSDSM